MEIIFKAHNILLANGDKTLPYNNTLLADRPIINVIKKTINNFINVRPEERKNLKVIDLGCMEGGYSVEFARMGFNTLGVDARKGNLLKAMYIKLNLNLSNLNFLVSDARNISKYGEFDIVFCTGLFYHLDNPVEFIKTVYKQTNKLFILNTFYAPDENDKSINSFKNLNIDDNVKEKIKEFNNNEAKKENYFPYLQHIKGTKLSNEISEHEGYKGRWFKEWDEDIEQSKIESMPGAAYNNHKSFWLCKSEIIRALYDAGFESVYEQHDDIGDLYSDNPDAYYPRVMLIATKSSN